MAWIMQDTAVHAATLVSRAAASHTAGDGCLALTAARSACEDVSLLRGLQALVATLTHDERLKDGQEVYLQFALLYTTTDGHRRIR